MMKSFPKPLVFLGFILSSVLLVSCATSSPEIGAPTPNSPVIQSPAPSPSEGQVAGAFIPYESFVTSGDKYSDSKVVLFFNAVWCSTCKQARDNIEASLGEIPEDLAIVLVDFDNSIELRKKYGVTVQHTFIQIDNSGEALAKWSGSITVADIVKQLN
jgi:thiol-disulfide isomerase/thioredoxin